MPGVLADLLLRYHALEICGGGIGQRDQLDTLDKPLQLFAVFGTSGRESRFSACRAILTLYSRLTLLISAAWQTLPDSLRWSVYASWS